MRKSRYLIYFSLFSFVTVGGYISWKSHREHNYDAEIAAASQRYQVDPALVKAVIWRETRFRADARGRAQEIGLMQIREAAAMDWASAEKVYPFEHEQILDPGLNTMVGTWYLDKLLKRYTHTDNPVPYALADYNAGRGNVLKWLSGEGSTNSELFIQQIGFPGTSNYVRAVIEKVESYRGDFPDTPSKITQGH